MGNVKYYCEYCDYSTDTERGLNIHVGRKHGKPIEKCEECKEEFETSPSTDRKFCSDECYRTHQQRTKENKEANCEVCGEYFEYHPSAYVGRFCSKKCQYKGSSAPSGQEHWNYKNEITKQCKNCDGKFNVKPHKAHQEFCSLECVGEYGEWEKPGRNKVERIKKDCHICGEEVIRLPSNITSDEGRVFCSEQCRGNWVSKSDIFNASSVYVNETNRTVASGWEAKVDRILHESVFEYEYESKTFTIGDGRNYTPDFIVEDDIVIEVKGQPSEHSYERSSLFLQEYGEDWLYIVVGTEMDSHIHISWNDYSKIPEVLENVI